MDDAEQEVTTIYERNVRRRMYSTLVEEAMTQLQLSEWIDCSTYALLCTRVSQWARVERWYRRQLWWYWVRTYQTQCSCSCTRCKKIN
jgi:hypothetical protein